MKMIVLLNNRSFILNTWNFFGIYLFGRFQNPFNSLKNFKDFPLSASLFNIFYLVLFLFSPLGFIFATRLIQSYKKIAFLIIF